MTGRAAGSASSGQLRFEALAGRPSSLGDPSWPGRFGHSRLKGTRCHQSLFGSPVLVLADDHSPSCPTAGAPSSPMPQDPEGPPARRLRA